MGSVVFDESHSKDTSHGICTSMKHLFAPQRCCFLKGVGSPYFIEYAVPAVALASFCLKNKADVMRLAHIPYEKRRGRALLFLWTDKGLILEVSFWGSFGKHPKYTKVYPCITPS